jgi:hypothetical protein
VYVGEIGKLLTIVLYVLVFGAVARSADNFGRRYQRSQQNTAKGTIISSAPEQARSGSKDSKRKL